MHKIENIIQDAQKRCVKFTHLFVNNKYTDTTKEIVNNDEIGLHVRVAKVPRSVDRWSYMTTSSVGTIVEIYFYYETENSSPQKKYLIRFYNGDMFCDTYEEVMENDFRRN